MVWDEEAPEVTALSGIWPWVCLTGKGPTWPSQGCPVRPVGGPTHPAALHNFLLQAGGCCHQEPDGLPRPEHRSFLGWLSQEHSEAWGPGQPLTFIRSVQELRILRGGVEKRERMFSVAPGTVTSGEQGRGQTWVLSRVGPQGVGERVPAWSQALLER